MFGGAAVIDRRSTRNAYLVVLAAIVLASGVRGQLNADRIARHGDRIERLGEELAETCVTRSYRTEVIRTVVHRDPDFSSSFLAWFDAEFPPIDCEEHTP